MLAYLYKSPMMTPANTTMNGPLSSVRTTPQELLLNGESLLPSMPASSCGLRQKVTAKHGHCEQQVHPTKPAPRELWRCFSPDAQAVP